eukprot:gb/GFBE01038128.1/.p1 GENE.gb/GFBE01038128.1/~~gb/GFBE01038128.1/.p1  ORF type:complete len:197 (+),score=28.63 gb/GFBE01038128.1/:1-591(+)
MRPEGSSPGSGDGQVMVENIEPTSPPPPPPPVVISDDEGEVHVEGGGSASPAPPPPGTVAGSAFGIDDGEVRIEGGSSPSPPPPVSVASVSVADSGSDLPKILEDEDSVGEAGAMKTTTPSASNTPTGHQLVVLLSLAAVALVGIAFMFPQLRRGPDRGRRGFGRQQDRRSRHEVPEEEIGLVSAGGFYQDDDDIL